jgi:hypothetical protein
MLNTATLMLFVRRFKDDVDEGGSLLPHAQSYFNEWQERLSHGLVYALSCADKETKISIMEVEQELNRIDLTLGGVEQ